MMDSIFLFISPRRFLDPDELVGSSGVATLLTLQAPDSPGSRYLGSQVAERLGNRSSNQKVAGSIPSRAK